MTFSGSVVLGTISALITFVFYNAWRTQVGGKKSLEKSTREFLDFDLLNVREPVFSMDAALKQRPLTMKVLIRRSSIADFLIYDTITHCTFQVDIDLVDQCLTFDDSDIVLNKDEVMFLRASASAHETFMKMLNDAHEEVNQFEARCHWRRVYDELKEE